MKKRTLKKLKNFRKKNNIPMKELEYKVYDIVESWYDDDTPEYLLEHCHDYWNNKESIIKSFIQNYKPTNVISILFAKTDYESNEAQEIIKKIGAKKTIDFIMNNIYLKSDGDIYHEHWNDIASENWDEYEVQIDKGINKTIDLYLKRKNLDYDYVYISLGIIRMKLDTENFEKEVNEHVKTKLLKIA